jgi:UrcA family protein
MKSIKLLTAAVAALALGGIAQAEAHRDETVSVIVKYGDLNLQSDEGVKILRKRIRNAAQTACGSLETKILGLRDAYEECVEEAFNGGVAAVGNPNVTNYRPARRLPAVASNRG